MSRWSLSPESSRSFELPGAKPHYTPDRPGQVDHIALDLVLDIPQQRYHGTCRIQLTPIRAGLTELTLDAVGLQITSVQVQDLSRSPSDAPLQACSFDYDGEILQIHLPQPTVQGQTLDLVIAYGVDQPQRGLYFVAPDADYPHKPVQVWTQGEDEDSRFWFPCFDYPGQLATSELRVQVPRPYQAISNGDLVSVTEVAAAEAGSAQAGDRIYHWRQGDRHPSYLITLAVGEFALVEDQWQGKPITYYVEPGQEEMARLSMGKTPRMVEFLSQKYGYPYPFPKYAQVCVEDFIFGGMENTSTTLLTSRCLLDARAALDDNRTESLVVHELAHQWFGDLVVIKHWSHAWIKEGMASYSEVMWLEQEYSNDEAAYYLLDQARNYLDEDGTRYRRPMVTHIYREAIELYDRHIYDRGACVYHMIRHELGEELFWQAMAKFVQTHAHQTVETIDLLRAIEAATGRNLAFLFDQYVYRGGHPDYKVEYRWDGEANLAQLTVTQTQAEAGATGLKGGLFDLKIPVSFGSGEAPAVTVKIRVHQQQQSFYFPLAAKPDYVSFDAGNPTLKTVELDYPLPELKAQLQSDPDPISRIYAAIALAKQGGLEALKALAQALRRDRFWGVRLEVASQLAQIRLDQVFPALLSGLDDPDPRVRKAVVQALATFKDQAAYQAIAPVARQGDASYRTEAAAITALGGIAAALQDSDCTAQTLALLTEVLQQRQGWNEVVRAGAIGALAQLKTSAPALDLILAQTQAGVAQPLRLAAIRALGSISTGQSPEQLTRILDRLAALTREGFFLTQVAVAVALGQMETPKAIALLQSMASQALDGRVKRLAEEQIQTVQAKIGPEPALKQLRQELDQIKQDNQTLRSRLASLEAKTEPEPPNA
jgi:aminopeptidase N